MTVKPIPASNEPTIQHGIHIDVGELVFFKSFCLNYEEKE